MTWLHGTAPTAAETWTSSQKHMAAHTLLKLFLTSCFEWRILHGDPHAGNIRLRLQDGQPIIGLLDFGCTRRIDLDTSAALRALIDRTIATPNSGGADAVFEHYLRLGFNADLLHPMKAVLPQLTGALFAPFAERGPFEMDAWRLGERVAAILGDHRWNFRMAGPAHLLVFLRAYQGLIQYLTFFNASLNWRQLYAQIGHAAKEPERQRPPQIRNGPAEPFASTALRIQVLESGKQKVALTFNARAAAYLKDLLPDDIAPKLVARGIDIGAMERSVVQTGFAAGELFALTDGEKRIRVWLE